MKCARLVVIVLGLLLAANVTAQEYICGDIDNDGDGPDIDDLVWMIDWMATGGPPPDTMIAANWAGCAGVNVYDLRELTRFLFTGGGVGPNCENSSECDTLVGGSITLDHTDGEVYPGTLLNFLGTTFYFRFTNNTGLALKSIANGFRIYSEGGLLWGYTTGSEVASFDLNTVFDLYWSIGYFSCDGSGADTVSFLGATMVGPGIPAGYDDNLVAIEIGGIFGSWDAQICLDTCWFPPAGDWLWVTDAGPAAPSWDGPHCFYITDCRDPEDQDCDGIWIWTDNCPDVWNHYQEDFDGDGIGDVCDPVCCADPGNVDHSEGGTIDIADLVYLVDYMFNSGPAPICDGEGNIDGVAITDIADLVYLVDYMFNDGPAPPACN